MISFLSPLTNSSFLYDINWSEVMCDSENLTEARNIYVPVSSIISFLFVTHIHIFAC